MAASRPFGGFRRRRRLRRLSASSRARRARRPLGRRRGERRRFLGRRRTACAAQVEIRRRSVSAASVAPYSSMRAGASTVAASAGRRAAFAASRRVVGFAYERDVGSRSATSSCSCDGARRAGFFRNVQLRRSHAFRAAGGEIGAWVREGRRDRRSVQCRLRGLRDLAAALAPPLTLDRRERRPYPPPCRCHLARRGRRFDDERDEAAPEPGFERVP